MNIHAKLRALCLFGKTEYGNIDYFVLVQKERGSELLFYDKTDSCILGTYLIRIENL